MLTGSLVAHLGELAQQFLEDVSHGLLETKSGDGAIEVGPA